MRRLYSSPDSCGFTLGIDVLRFPHSFIHDSLNFLLTQRSLKYKRLVKDAAIAPPFTEYRCTCTNAEVTSDGFAGLVLPISM
jgi:hypothetical protein